MSVTLNSHLVDCFYDFECNSKINNITSLIFLYMKLYKTRTSYELESSLSQSKKQVPDAIHKHHIKHLKD